MNIMAINSTGGTTIRVPRYVKDWFKREYPHTSKWKVIADKFGIPEPIDQENPAQLSIYELDPEIDIPEED
jgi:hypothetical protein